MERNAPAAANATPKPPLIPELPPLEPFGPGSPEADEHYESRAAVSLDWDHSVAPAWRLAVGELRRVRAANARWLALRLFDVRLVSCDFANADWTGSGLQRVDGRNCRLTGANWSECRWADVSLVDCKMDQFVCHQSRLSACRLERCDLRGADFESSDLRGTVFRDCDLRGARFARAQLSGVDLRGSKLDGIGVDPTALRGVILEPAQALAVAETLGVVLRPLGTQD